MKTEEDHGAEGRRKREPKNPHFRTGAAAALSDRRRHYGTERRESAEEAATRIVEEAVRKAGWTDARLAETKNGHEFKVRPAMRLRRETTMTWAWIAERLRMGSRSNAANLVYAQEKAGR